MSLVVEAVAVLVAVLAKTEVVEATLHVVHLLPQAVVVVLVVSRVLVVAVVLAEVEVRATAVLVLVFLGRAITVVLVLHLAVAVVAQEALVLTALVLQT